MRTGGLSLGAERGLCWALGVDDTWTTRPAPELWRRGVGWLGILKELG